MRWLKWILAYLFDCIHRHTMWPHRDRREGCTTSAIFIAAKSRCI